MAPAHGPPARTAPRRPWPPELEVFGYAGTDLVPYVPFLSSDLVRLPPGLALYFNMLFVAAGPPG